MEEVESDHIHARKLSVTPEPPTFGVSESCNSIVLEGFCNDQHLIQWVFVRHLECTLWVVHTNREKIAHVTFTRAEI